MKQLQDTQYALNLDDNFDPLDDNYTKLKSKKFTFQGGESHFQIEDEFKSGDLTITQRFNKAEDLIMILLANDAAKRAGYTNIELILPYFPAARQDRVCNDGEPLTIKVFADMINSCGFSAVYILSPHSEVTPALINNCKLLDLDNKFVAEIVFNHNGFSEYNIVCPDAGAGKRVANVVKFLVNSIPSFKFNLIRCEKVRDVKDGSLKEFHVQADDLGGHPTIIIDDICCLGNTFKGLGEVLRSKNCGKLSLFTSHSDCLAGIENMCSFFDNVYVTNSKYNWGDCNFPNKYRLRCYSIKL